LTNILFAKIDLKFKSYLLYSYWCCRIKLKQKKLLSEGSAVYKKFDWFSDMIRKVTFKLEVSLV
jgi:hypothetical protein